MKTNMSCSLLGFALLDPKQIRANNAEILKPRLRNAALTPVRNRGWCDLTKASYSICAAHVVDDFVCVHLPIVSHALREKQGISYWSKGSIS